MTHKKTDGRFSWNFIKYTRVGVYYRWFLKKKFCYCSYYAKKPKKNNQISISKIIVGLQGMDTRNPPFETRTTHSGAFQQVRRGCRCNCRCNGIRSVPQDLEENSRQSQTQTPPRQRGNFETTALHKPPWQASTPESLTSTPDTVVKTQQSSSSLGITINTPQSTTALIYKRDDENDSDNTRSKTKSKKRLNLEFIDIGSYWFF